MAETPRISIVDDDEYVRSALCRLFASVGYTVASYDSAEAFLDAVPEEPPDCLVLDVHLPGRSGIELQSDLRAENSVTPIVFVTAHDDKQAMSRAFDEGALAFLRKPLDSERLLEVIEDALKA